MEGKGEGTSCSTPAFQRKKKKRIHFWPPPPARYDINLLQFHFRTIFPPLNPNSLQNPHLTPARHVSTPTVLISSLAILVSTRPPANLSISIRCHFSRFNAKVCHTFGMALESDRRKNWHFREDLVSPAPGYHIIYHQRKKYLHQVGILFFFFNWKVTLTPAETKGHLCQQFQFHVLHLVSILYR